MLNLFGNKKLSYLKVFFLLQPNDVFSLLELLDFYIEWHLTSGQIQKYVIVLSPFGLQTTLSGDDARVLKHDQVHPLKSLYCHIGSVDL